jgi:hypothetical protein
LFKTTSEKIILEATADRVSRENFEINIENSFKGIKVYSIHETVTGVSSLDPGARKFLSHQRKNKDRHRGDLSRSWLINAKQSKKVYFPRQESGQVQEGALY